MLAGGVRQHRVARLVDGGKYRAAAKPSTINGTARIKLSTTMPSKCPKIDLPRVVPRDMPGEQDPHDRQRRQISAAGAEQMEELLHQLNAMIRCSS